MSAFGIFLTSSFFLAFLVCALFYKLLHIGKPDKEAYLNLKSESIKHSTGSLMFVPWVKYTNWNHPTLLYSQDFPISLLAQQLCLSELIDSGFPPSILCGFPLLKCKLPEGRNCLFYLFLWSRMSNCSWHLRSI